MVEGSIFDPKGQTAYIATGSHGLAIVNATVFSNPIILGQLDRRGVLEGSAGRSVARRG